MSEPEGPGPHRPPRRDEDSWVWQQASPEEVPPTSPAAPQPPDDGNLAGGRGPAGWLDEEDTPRPPYGGRRTGAGEPSAAGPAARYQPAAGYQPLNGQSSRYPARTGADPGPSAQRPGVSFQPRGGQPAAQPAAAAADVVRIGLWGSPRSGKTTFLAALPHAAIQRGGNVGTWRIVGADSKSNTVLMSLKKELLQGRFPQGTQPGSGSALSWRFEGDLAGSRFVPRRHRPGRGRPVLSKFQLDLIDFSGEAYDYEPVDASADDADLALQHLTASDGIIYLFDPLRERDRGDATNYLIRPLSEMGYRLTGRGAGPHLPQHVAICVTKFDHPDVFKEARRLGLVRMGPNGMPAVPDERAEEFFDLLCTGNFWSQQHEGGNRSARFARDELVNAFGAGKIRYFVSSSIGFWRQPAWAESPAGFDPDVFSNFRWEEGGAPGIKGEITPVNVLEPLIQLQQLIKQARSDARR